MYSVLLLAGSLLTHTVSAKKCRDVTVPVNVDARQGVFNLPELRSNPDATEFAQKLTSNHGNFTHDILTGYRTVTGTYNISATFCTPDTNRSSSIVQVLTHGIGADKTYVAF